MASRNIHYYLVRTARATGWLLLVLMLLYMVTGLAMRGEFGLDRVLAYEPALAIHQAFIWPLIGIFAAHSLVTIYFAMRRWGWIGKRTKGQTSRDRPTP